MSRTFTNTEKLQKDLLTLFELENNLFDFEIIIHENAKTDKKTSFFCHRAILSCRSEYFKGLFRSNMKEYQEGKVELTGIPIKIMKVVLTYIYSGNITITQENAIEILIFAKKFCFEELASFCTIFIKENISLENVIDLLNLSHQFDCDRVHSYCINFMLKNFQNLFMHPDFSQIQEKDLQQIIQSDNLYVEHEVELFNSLISWAQANINYNHDFQKLSNDLQSSKIRQKLNGLINRIRFCEIPHDEISKIQRMNLVDNQVMSDVLLFQKAKLEKNHEKISELKQKALSQKIQIFQRRSCFRDSRIVHTKQHENYIKEWVNNKDFFKKIKLGFSGKRDGFDCHQFHKLCDNKGQTLVLIQTTQRYIFGGFSSVGWNNDISTWSRCRKDFDGNYFGFISDENAFLFSLKNHLKIPPAKFPVKNGKEDIALRYHDKYGPTFGLYDIYIQGNLKNGRTNFGNSYTLPKEIEESQREATAFFAGSFDKWEIEEIEIFFSNK
ncbi:pep-cterm sorting domain-containing protein [Anaeramoeba ignava]|uniref:Pep-cterm sorting domain-containing protein n=1 Tax=Anaeramoeba ignava TaxID=1746090 RepID=A0A9Q0LTU8_ANAIG|nr:pep-cterm sorting domain-containing protein [Anaeramoeba ignava]|eukprot:Anaeramoba_ignava/c17302_g2_i1.p1 GENE.c17302_g2_i1~~c17302_g2_i1.p1  ORF type:complete len:522 (-),score=156.81 c17302_g2_i1:165-1655(-)